MGNTEFTNLQMFFGGRDMESGVQRTRKAQTLIYVLSGNIRITEKCGNYDFSVREGELAYLPAGDTAAVYTSEHDKILIIKFDLHTGELPDMATIIPKESGCEALKTADYTAKQLSQHRERDHSFFCMLTYKLIYELKEYALKQVPIKFHKLFPVIDELRSHPEADRKIADYADMCSMSEVGFRKLFMEYTGKTPVEYRTRLRLEMAADMLCDGEYSVTEAAEKCGFNSISFFCREFKKYYGYNAGAIMK